MQINEKMDSSLGKYVVKKGGEVVDKVLEERLKKSMESVCGFLHVMLVMICCLVIVIHYGRAKGLLISMGSCKIFIFKVKLAIPHCFIILMQVH